MSRMDGMDAESRQLLEALRLRMELEVAAFDSGRPGQQMEGMERMEGMETAAREQ